MMNWKKVHAGQLYQTYQWSKNTNIKAKFSTTDEGVNVGIWYDEIPIEFTSYSKDTIEEVVSRSLPAIDKDLNWFVENFQNLLQELAIHIGNSFNEVNNV